MSIISVHNLSKTFSHPQGDIHVFSNISFSAHQGESTAIIGESGRGKTTLLYLLSGLDHADTGSVVINDCLITQLNETELALFRAQHFGFIFQHHFLLSDLNALDNALLPLRISHRLTKDTKEEVLELFHYFGLEERLYHSPDELSGGEKQRVAVIRALANKPLIIFADEPTGSLDKDNAYLLQELLFKITNKQQSTLILSTHNIELAQQCDHLFTIDELENNNDIT